MTTDALLPILPPMTGAQALDYAKANGITGTLIKRYPRSGRELREYHLDRRTPARILAQPYQHNLP